MKRIFAAAVGLVVSLIVGFALDGSDAETFLAYIIGSTWAMLLISLDDRKGGGDEL